MLWSRPVCSTRNRNCGGIPMIQRLTRTMAVVGLLAAVAALAWADGRVLPKNQCDDKHGCCADACPRDESNEDAPCCSESCPASSANPCRPCKPAVDAAGNCVDCCEAAEEANKTAAESGACCCQAVAAKASEGCQACCKAMAAKVAQACCACCKGECKCAKKEVGCCSKEKGCCASAKKEGCSGCCKAKSAESCCGCCKAAAKVADSCCGCCKAAVKATASCGGCCKSIDKAGNCCSGCCTAAEKVADSCCACCKGECACCKKAAAAACKCSGACCAKVTESACKCCGDCCAKVAQSACKCCAECCAKAASSGCKCVSGAAIGSPVNTFRTPIVAPLMVLPHVPAAPPIPFMAPIPSGPCAPPPAGALDHTTFVAPNGCAGVACSMPAPIAPAMTPASAPKQFEVSAKLVECKYGEEDRVRILPKLTVLEGQPGKCSVATKDAVGSMRVVVQRVQPDVVVVDFRVSKRANRHESEGAVSTCQSCSGVRRTKVDEVVRIPVCKKCEETECGRCGKWIELVVKECASTGAPTAMVPACSPNGMSPDTCVSPCLPCPSACVAPTASWAGNVRVVPELVRCGAVEAKPEASVRSISATSDGCVQVRTDDCTVRGTAVTLTFKDTTVTLRSDEVKGQKRVCLEADCDLEAVADRMKIECEGRIVLEGEVKLMCASPSSGMAQHVEAERVIVEFDAGKMKSIQVVPEKP